MPFDPSAPFEVVAAEAPAFDPAQPFERLSAPAFDPAQPFERVSPDPARAARRDALLAERRRANLEGVGADVLTALAGGGEAALETVRRMNPLSAVRRAAWAASETVHPTGQPFPEVPAVEKWTPELAGDVLRAIGGPGSTDLSRAGTVAGVANAASDLGEFFLTDEGAATLAAGGAPALARAALAAGFAGQMSSHLPEAAAQAGELSVAGGPEAVRSGLGALGTAAFAGAIPIGAIGHGRAAARGRQVVEIAPEAAPVRESRVAPTFDPAKPFERVARELPEVAPYPAELAGQPYEHTVESISESAPQRGPATLPEAPAYPEPLEGQPYEIPNSEFRIPNAAAPSPLNLQRERPVDPDLADAIQAVREGYVPEVEAASSPGLPDNSMPKPTGFQDWRIQGNTFRHSVPGKLLTEAEGQAIIEAMPSYGIRGRWDATKKAVVVNSGLMSDAQRMWAEIGSIAKKTQAQRDQSAAVEARREQAEAARNEELKASPSAGWIDSVFGPEAMNAFNKLELAKFLEGKTDKFGGQANPKWQPGLARLGVTSLDELRSAYQRAPAKAAESLKAETAQQPVPGFVVEAGIKTWQQAKKRGVESFIPKALEVAQEITNGAANWIYGSLPKAAEQLATEMVQRIAVTGGRETAFKSLANDYFRKSQNASEPGQKERLGAIAQGLERAAKPPPPSPPPSAPAKAAPAPAMVSNSEFRIPNSEVPEVPTATAIHPEMVPTVEFPIAKLKLSKDVPNFKGGASEETGTVAGQELAGKYQRTGTAPIVAWERSNGDVEVITGRHRLDLARRTGEQTIPTQIVREADGFTKDMALTFDAEANIRDGQGEVADYATYFKGTEITEAEARARGLLSRAKGKAGWSLAKAATDDVYALWRADKLTDAQAVAIANAAPGDAGAQQIGSKFALQGKGADFITNVIKASQAEAGQRAESLDLFGKDDSAMKTMAEQAERASQFQRDISERIKAVANAAKRPEIARAEGVDVRDPEGVVKRIGELKAELARWENWPMQPDLVAKVKGESNVQRPVVDNGDNRGGYARGSDYPLDARDARTLGRLLEGAPKTEVVNPSKTDEIIEEVSLSVSGKERIRDFDGKHGDWSVRIETPQIAGGGAKTEIRAWRHKPFSLAPAESVEQQKARLAQEQAAREAKAQQDKLAELQAKPLQGTPGDLGQGDLLKAPEDLFAPPTPKPGNTDINTGALGNVGMGGAKPSEYAQGQHTATGIKNATVDAERVRRGLPPAMEAGHRAWPVVWPEAMARVDADPEVQDRLIASLKANPRAVTDLEDALLLHRQVDLQNEYAKATRELAQAYEDAKTFPNRAEAVAELKVRTAELSDRLLELYDVNKAVGTETGRGLAARKMMAYEDFSLAKMEMEKRAAKGGAPLTDAERAEMVRLQQRIEQTQAAYDEYRAKVEQERANRMTDEAIADMKRELASRPNYDPRIVKIAEEIVTKLERQAAKSDAAIREMLSRASAGVDPTLVYHLGVKGAAMIARRGLDFAKFSLELAETYGEKVKPYLQAAWERANLHLDNEGAKYGDKAEPVKRLLRKRDAAGQREGAVEGLKKAKEEGIPLSLAGDYIRKLALSFVRGGITEREALVDAVHKVVTEDVGMDLTRRETMDAISGYGSFKPLDREAAKVLLRDLKGQMQQVAKLEDITARKPLQKSGVERRPQSDEERRLIQQVNEAKRRFGVVVTDPARQLKSALDAVKTRLKNQIADLEYQISTKERIVKSKTDAPFDAETKLMEVRRDELRRQLDELVPKPGRTDEQLLAASMRAVERTIADYEQRIVAGDVAVKKAKPTITSAELEALKARRDAVRAEWRELRALDGEFQRQQAEKTLERQRGALEESIAAKEKELAAGPQPPSGREVNRPADPALESLMQKRDALNRQLAEARKKPAEQKAAEALARRLAAMQKAIAEREAKLKAGDYSTKATAKASRPLSTPELEVARQQLDALNRQLAEARRGPKRSPEEIALAALKTRLTKLAADYADRVASKDYAPRVRKPVILDAEASRLKAIAERAKGEWRKAVALDRLANRSTAEKVMDATVKWHRAAILSSPAVITKLTAAAAYRTLLGPIEEATKLAWARVMPELANAAPRQSGLLLRAEVKALTEGMTAGMRDAWQMLKTGEADLDVLYGKGKDPAGIGEKFVLPPTWLDFFGHLHGALKAPVKRAEWARSMEKRMAWNAARGVDVTDPGVQIRLGVEAYKDAQRAIFLQDNRVVDVYKAALRRMEDKDKATGQTPLRWKVAATTSRLALPIVKVPSNIVAETLETATGLVTGGYKAARAYRNGLASLAPEEADAIMRQLGKGSLGGALLLLGFYTAGNWGGFYVHGEKRDPKDIKAGAARVDGVDIPKHMLHYPLIDAVQFGATVARVSGAKAHKRDQEPQGVGPGVAAALLGLADEVPFVREGTALDRLRDPSQRDRYLAEKLKSLAIPQAVQWTARELDKNAAGEVIRRDPKNTLQVLQTGVPYYRNAVPEKVDHRQRK